MRALPRQFIFVLVIVAAFAVLGFVLAPHIFAAWVDAPNNPPTYGSTGCSPAPCLENDFKPLTQTSVNQSKWGWLAVATSSAPAYPLDVTGQVNASGGLCIAGVCQTSWSAVAGVSGAGTLNYLSKWASGSSLGNSLVFDNGTNVGIGTTVFTTDALHASGYKLEANGDITANGFYDRNNTTYYLDPASSLSGALAGSLTVGTTLTAASLNTTNLKVTGGTLAAGNVLTSDVAGNATWQTPTAGSNYWTLSGSNISNNNTGNVGVGATTPFSMFHTQGSVAKAGTGTVAVNAINSATGPYNSAVTGTGTSFTTEEHVGDIMIVGGTSYQITSIASNTSLTLLGGPWSAIAAGTTFQYQQPISRFADSSGSYNDVIIDAQGKIRVGGPMLTYNWLNNQYGYGVLNAYGQINAVGLNSPADIPAQTGMVGIGGFGTAGGSITSYGTGGSGVVGIGGLGALFNYAGVGGSGVEGDGATYPTATNGIYMTPGPGVVGNGGADMNSLSTVTTGVGGAGVNGKGGYSYYGTGGAGVYALGGQGILSGSKGGDAIYAVAGTGVAASGYAGNFQGNVNVTGNLYGNGVKGAISGGIYSHYVGLRGICGAGSNHSYGALALTGTSQAAGSDIVNPLTGAANCPSGFTDTIVWAMNFCEATVGSVGYDLHMCWR